MDVFLVLEENLLKISGTGGWWRWALLSLDGVAPSQVVCVSVLIFPSTIKSKFSSGTGSPGWC